MTSSLAPPHAKSRSLWTETTFGTHYPQLAGQLEVDVAIVGGGVTGLSAGLLLKQAGLRVAVCERERLAVNLTAGHLTESADIPFHDLARAQGDAASRAAWESAREAINTVNQFLEQHRIVCGFQWVPGFAFAEDRVAALELEREAEALRRLDIPHRSLRAAPLPFAVHAAIEFPNQAQLHPRRYLLGLAEALSGDGCYVFERTRVTRVSPGEVRTESAQIRAREILVTSGEPEFANGFESPLTAFRQRVIGVRTHEEPTLPGLCWDARHRLRSQNVGGSPWLLISDLGQPDTGPSAGRAFDDLEDYARSRFEVDAIDYRWSGRIWRSATGGPQWASHQGVHAAAGFGDHDLTLGTAMARRLAERALAAAIKTPRPSAD